MPRWRKPKQLKTRWGRRVLEGHSHLSQDNSHSIQVNCHSCCFVLSIQVQTMLNISFILADPFLLQEQASLSMVEHLQGEVTLLSPRATISRSPSHSRRDGPYLNFAFGWLLFLGSLSWLRVKEAATKVGNIIISTVSPQKIFFSISPDKKVWMGGEQWVLFSTLHLRPTHKIHINVGGVGV